MRANWGATVDRGAARAASNGNALRGNNMPRGKGIYDDENADEPKGGRPGPTDEGGKGGMGTREHTPDVDEASEEPTA
jgi:hypothetical protein